MRPPDRLGEFVAGTSEGLYFEIVEHRPAGVRGCSAYFIIAPTAERAKEVLKQPVPNSPDGDTFVDVVYFRGPELRKAVPKVLAVLHAYRTRPPGSMYMDGDRDGPGGAGYRCAMCGLVEYLQGESRGHVERDHPETEKARAYHARWERIEERLRAGWVPVYGLALTTLQVWGRSLVKHDPDGWWIGPEDLADLLAFKDLKDSPKTAVCLAFGALFVEGVRAGERLLAVVQRERQGLQPDLRYVLGEEYER